MRSGLVYLTVQPTQVELLSRGVAQKPGGCDPWQVERPSKSHIT